MHKFSRKINRFYKKTRKLFVSRFNFVLRKIKLSIRRNNKKLKKINFTDNVYFARTFVLATVFVVWFGMFSMQETNSYYKDKETSLNNTFVSGEVDFLLESTNFVSTTSAISLAPNEIVQKTITVLPENSNPFKYTASTTNVTGDLDFCAVLNLDADLEGEDTYDGLLVDSMTQATTTLAIWNFAIGMGGNNFQNSICNFDTDYFGSQTRHNYPLGGGYHDVETVNHTIASWGLRLNKIYYDVDREIIIEPDVNMCEARSQGYWGNHEGCSMGSGSSVWETEINALSSSYSGVFSSTTGANMCVVLHIPSCPSGGTTAGKLCRAKNKLLADELNIVSGKLDPNAIIAGADNGNVAFDNLGLSSLSTIDEAISAVESILANNASTDTQIVEAGLVAERIYAFYENENNEAPMCLYDEEYLKTIILKEEEGDNEWVEIYNQTDTPLDINGWQICDNTSCDVLSASSPIPPQGYGLIVASTTTASNVLPKFWYLPLAVVEITIPDNKIGNGLGNNDDMLILKRPDGVIIDQMNYGDANPGWTNYNSDVWNPGAPDVAEGNVLARVPSGYDTNQPSDWQELVPPSADLIYPDEAGSYTWYWGNTYNILWNAVNNNSLSSLFIDLFYIKDLNHDSAISDGDQMLPIVNNTENDGSYEWTLPSGFTGYIWVYLVATGPENPMLNTARLSGDIWDPLQFFVISPDEDPENVDLEAPVITLNGNNPAVIEQGSSYSDLGAIVTDNVNDNLGFSTEGDVDTSTPGEYEIVFTAVDQAGNTGHATRTVIVYDPAVGPPAIEETQTEESTEVAETSGGSSAPVEETEEESEESTEEVVEIVEEEEGETASSTEPVTVETFVEVSDENSTTTEEVIEEEKEEEVTEESGEEVVEEETTEEDTTETTEEEIIEEEPAVVNKEETEEVEIKETDDSELNPDETNTEEAKLSETEEEVIDEETA